jgi:hypothetical protein
MQEERKETKNPMNRTQHLDNPPLLIRAIDCIKHVASAQDCHPGHRFGTESSLSKQSQSGYRIVMKNAKQSQSESSAYEKPNKPKSQRRRSVPASLSLSRPKGTSSRLPFLQNKPKYPHFQSKNKLCQENQTQFKPKKLSEAKSAATQENKANLNTFLIL